MFNKNKLSAAIVALAAGGSNYAMAQENPIVEEVIVTGIRASVQAAMDIKRDSSGVVDAISAEDIGKFPDTNLAESLQRITGISIDRVAGEGSQITVRGFGPDFNMVTLNGRTMPGGSAYGGGSGADASTRGGNSRAFDFANLASEAVAGVQAYKTGKANISAGGIGATVNISTTRPLDNPGLNFTVAGKAVHDTTVRIGDDVTPEVSGLVSWTDDNEMFGVSLSASFQQRDSGYTGATVNEWQTGVWGDPDADLYGRTVPATETTEAIPYWEDDVFVNAPEFGQLYTRPNDIRYAFSDRSRDRTNAQLTLQFAPQDNIVATLDVVHAQNSIEEFRGEITNWIQNASNLTAVVFDDGGIAVPSLVSEDYRGDGTGTRDIGFAQQYRAQENTLESIGLNLEWGINDQLTMTFDVHNSTMDSLPTGPGQAGELDVEIEVDKRLQLAPAFQRPLRFATLRRHEPVREQRRDEKRSESNPVGRVVDGQRAFWRKEEQVVADGGGDRSGRGEHQMMTRCREEDGDEKKEADARSFEIEVHTGQRDGGDHPRSGARLHVRALPADAARHVCVRTARWLLGKPPGRQRRRRTGARVHAERTGCPSRADSRGRGDRRQLRPRQGHRPGRGPARGRGAHQPIRYCRPRLRSWSSRRGPSAHQYPRAHRTTPCRRYSKRCASRREWQSPPTASGGDRRASVQKSVLRGWP